MPAERVCFWFSLLGQVCCRALQLRTNSEENGHTARQDAKWGTLQKVFEIQALRRFACCPCQLGITWGQGSPHHANLLKLLMWPPPNTHGTMHVASTVIAATETDGARS